MGIFPLNGPVGETKFNEVSFKVKNCPCNYDHQGYDRHSKRVPFRQPDKSGYHHDERMEDSHVE